MQPIPPLTRYPTALPHASESARGRVAVQEAAEAFEALFLAEMLAQAGIGKPPDAFGGGSGETAFASFLTQAYAEKIAATGRFGIAEAIVRAAIKESPADA